MILGRVIALDSTSRQTGHRRRACGTAPSSYNWGLAEWQRNPTKSRRPLRSSGAGMRAAGPHYVAKRAGARVTLDEIGRAYGPKSRRRLIGAQEAAAQGVLPPTYPSVAAVEASRPRGELAQECGKQAGDRYDATP
jgi:hypothetical protein